MVIKMFWPVLKRVEKCGFSLKWNAFIILSFAHIIQWVTVQFSAQATGEVVYVSAREGWDCAHLLGEVKKKHFCGISLIGGRPAWPYQENGTCAPPSWLNKSHLNIQDQTKHAGQEESWGKTEDLDLDLVVRIIGGFTGKWRRLCSEFWAF